MTHDIQCVTFLKISGRYRRCGHNKQCATEKGKEDVLNMNKKVSRGEDQVNEKTGAAQKVKT